MKRWFLEFEVEVGRSLILGLRVSEVVLRRLWMNGVAVLGGDVELFWTDEKLLSLQDGAKRRLQGRMFYT